MERRRVLYRGNVQGVGFRYTARSAAGRLAVTGYVRNLPDGRVELVAEGAAEEIDRLLGDLRDALGSHIRGTDVSRQAATGEFAAFEIIA